MTQILNVIKKIEAANLVTSFVMSAALVVLIGLYLFAVEHVLNEITILLSK